MNYRPFLNSRLTSESNRHIKFKNKNRYIVNGKKKNSRFWLMSAVISVGMIGMVATLLANSDSTELLSQHHISQNKSNKEQLSTTLSPTSENNAPLSQTSSDLELPAISYTSTITKDSATKSSTLVQKNNEAALPENTEEPAVNTSETPVIAHIVPVVSPEKPSQLSRDLLKKTLSSVNKAETETVKADNSVVHNKAKNPQQTTGKTLTVKVKKGDTLSAIFKRHSLNSSSLYKIINSGKAAKQLTRIKPGQSFSIVLDEHNDITQLEFRINKVDTLFISLNDKGYTPEIRSKEIETRQQFTAGIINNSLFYDGQKAGLNSALIMKLAHIFGWDVDFALDIRKGDSFAVLYEEQYVDGKKINSGDILSAEFVNQGKVFRAIRYTDASGHTDYYSEKGLSMRKASLRSPVAFSRISSRFSTGRKHPVLNKIRAHKGVDYAASRGTPIKAVGDGKVIFKGRKGGYGRVIILQHGSKYTTLYAHMNAYNKKLRNGSRVKQGQVIGYVGSSGLATGPHLHYEFRINGVHRNPLTVKLPSAAPISKKYRADFKVAAETLISQLKLRKQETIALNSH